LGKGKDKAAQMHGIQVVASLFILLVLLARIGTHIATANSGYALNVLKMINR
jgi:hypothetical protein